MVGTFLPYSERSLFHTIKKTNFEILLQLLLEVLFHSLPRKLEGDQDGFIKWEMSPVSLENKYLPLSLDLILYFIIETIMGGGLIVVKIESIIPLNF